MFSDQREVTTHEIDPMTVCVRDVFRVIVNLILTKNRRNQANTRTIEDLIYVVIDR
jgi:hypothetical protein